MFAIVEIAGKQYKVTPNSQVTVDLISQEPKSVYHIDKVLLTSDDEGKNVEIGAPYLEKSITASVVDHGKGEKVTVFKFVAKKRQAKKQGHRQNYTVLEVGSF